MSLDVHRDVEAFLFREARLLDERQYRAWEALWHEEATYWVPSTLADTDPARHVSIIFDDREMIARRVARLSGPDSDAEQPAASVARVISNVEVAAEEAALTAWSTFVAVSFRSGRLVTWAGRTTHVLRRDAQAGLRMTFKKVVLVNCEDFLPHLTFLP